MKAFSLFHNFFDVREITNTRLHNFATTTISRMKTDTEHGDKWASLLPSLMAATENFGTEIGAVDTGTNIRMGSTDTVDDTLHSFGRYLLDNEPFIARALGGRDQPAFLEFYPTGTPEYTHATKTTAPLLLQRIATAGAKYAGIIGEPLATDLQRFIGIYETQRGAQQGNMGVVDEHRSQRINARPLLELLLLQAIHQVGNAFPGDVAHCNVYFEFERLYPHHAGHKKSDEGINDSSTTPGQP